MSHTIGQVKSENQQSSNPSQVAQNSSAPENKAPEPTSLLSDADYEFLFNQLLEGIAHGWHDRRIAKFFEQLGDRGLAKDWIAWLERLRIKILGLPIQSKRQLGTLMIRFGELTQSTPEVKEIGSVAHLIGRELLFGNNQELIWEYAGPDIIPSTPTVKSKEDLSERLPTDFTELASPAIEDTQSDITAQPKSPADSNDDLLPDAPSTAVTEVDEDTSQDSNYSQLKLEPKTDNLSENKSESLEDDFPEKPDPNPVAIDIKQVMDLIQRDENLAQEISQKLNISTVNSEPENTLVTSSIDLDNSSIELIEGWFNLGLKQVSAGEFDKAIVSWEKALKINPNLSEAWHNRGSALGRLGKYEEAVQSFQKALAIDPENYQAWNDRAHGLYQLQQWSEAAESWSNAIKIMPGNHLFWYNRGCALEQLESWTDSIVSYEKSLEIKPDFGPARSRYTTLVADNSHAN